MAWFHLKDGFKQSNKLPIRAVTGLQGMLRDVGFSGPYDGSAVRRCPQPSQMAGPYSL
jgi:hypothetical protein